MPFSEAYHSKYVKNLLRRPDADRTGAIPLSTQIISYLMSPRLSEYSTHVIPQTCVRQDREEGSTLVYSVDITTKDEGRLLKTMEFFLENKATNPTLVISVSNPRINTALTANITESSIYKICERGVQWWPNRKHFSDAVFLSLLTKIADATVSAPRTRRRPASPK